MSTRDSNKEQGRHMLRIWKGTLALVSGIVLLLGVGVVRTFAEDIGAAIEAANKQFVAALRRGDGARIAGMYTANAQMFPASSDILSGQAI
jgi:hypothetical protein